MTDATLLTDRRRPAVRLARQLIDPPEVVWLALTDREQLRAWFPCDVIVAGKGLPEQRLSDDGRGDIAYRDTYGSDRELGEILFTFAVWARPEAGYECINEVVNNSNGTCYIYQPTQQGNFIVGDASPRSGRYAEFDCSWQSPPQGS